MAAFTLGEWRDWTLEQVHFAAKAALDAAVVKGNPSMRESVAAMATGDINQCMAQGPNINYARRISQGLGVSSTAAPGCATTPDIKGELSINNLAEAIQRLEVENALFHILKPHHALQPQEVDLFFNKTFSFLVQDGYITDITEDRHEFLEPNLADDNLRFVKHEGSQRIFGIETKLDGSGVVYAVDLDARRVLHGDAEKRKTPTSRAKLGHIPCMKRYGTPIAGFSGGHQARPMKSYRAAKRENLPSVEHRQHCYLNNRAENSH
jgi:hypothetical protein